MEPEQLTITTNIKDEIGNEFQAEVIFNFEELEKQLSVFGYKLVKVKK